MMSHKRFFSFLLLPFAVLIFDARVANACSCASTATVLDAYEESSVVVIAKAVSVEKSEKSYDGIGSTKMIVEKVYKGKLRVGDEMIFGQGGGADCIWTFDERSIDRQFLFYLGSPRKNPKMWFAVVCGRSTGLQHAGHDLLYLDNLDKVRGKTRISGTIGFDGDEDLSVEGRLIRIIGANKTYEVKTDRNGVYEIYGLPAGKYLIEPEAPAGWKVDIFWLRYSESFAGNAEDERPFKKIPIILQDKKHAALDIHFEIDNAIRGKIYDTEGMTMEGVCIKAVRTQGQTRELHHDCTDKDGNFAITGVPRGSYILVINDEGKISSREPFKTFYYPNVFERDKAAVISIGAGDFLEGLNIYAPEMEETITVEGTLLYSDGKPVANESVLFKAEKSRDNFDGDARDETDSQGRFSLKILKGLSGQLYGEMYTYIGKFENCPKLESLIKKTGHDSLELKTPVIEIQALNDLQDLDLRYPVPGCKKAKRF